jgi:agmatinase
VTPDLLRIEDLGDVDPEPGRGGAAGGGAAGSVPVDDAARRAYFDRVQRLVTERLGRPGPGGGPPFLLTIGGDHSVGIPLLRGFSAGKPGGYGLISLDAHPDLFDTYEGSPLSSACPLRRALDSTNLDPADLLILGTRSYNAVELEFMRAQGIRFVPARDLDAMGMEAAVALARERMAGVRDVYLTIDIDVADPGCAPGTGAPVAGGLSGRQLLNLVRGLLEGLPVRALDILEVSPPLDPTEATLFLALQDLLRDLRGGGGPAARGVPGGRVPQGFLKGASTPPGRELTDLALGVAGVVVAMRRRRWRRGRSKSAERGTRWNWSST